jgi:hypothetical protein
MLKLNQNNLNEYLKKTEAEQIYMKKINSINMSFTSLLTSIQSVFSTYDYQLSTIANSLNILNINTGNLNNSLSNLINSYTLYTSNNDNETNSIKSNVNALISHSNSVDSEISNLWNAINVSVDYNYWKEFNKESQETYIKYENGQITILDNEEFGYKTNLSNYTLFNPSKLSYVFNSNILQTDENKPFNFGGYYDRIGLILPNCQSGATTYNQSVPMNIITMTCKTLDVMLKYHWSDFNTNFYVKCLDANLINSGMYCDYNIISTNLDATALKFDNYHKNSGTSFYSSFKLNNRIQVLGPWLDDNVPAKIDLKRTTLAYTNEGYPNLNRLSFVGLNNNISLHNNINGEGSLGFGVGKLAISNKLEMTNGYNYVFDIQNNYVGNNNLVNLVNETSNTNQSYTVSFAPEFQVSSIYITNKNHVDLNIPTGINSFNTGNKNVRFNITNYNNTLKLTISKWNALTCSLNGVPYITAAYNTLKDLTIAGDTNFNVSTGLLSSLTLYNNYVSWVKYINSCSSLINLNYNSFENFQITDIGKGFSFGANFKNSVLGLSANGSGTYYSYDNDSATVNLSQGLFKLLDFTAGIAKVSAGGSMENCVFSSLDVDAKMGLGPYGDWKYVWANSFNLINPLIFYQNKLQFDYAFYHCPFIQLSNTGLNAAMNLTESQCSKSLVFVDNAPTTSVNFRLTGDNTSKSIHAKLIESQPYIISADIRGWHPSRIIGFDQYYLFNNVASGYSALPEYKFTAHVDNVNDWTDYKLNFNPFGDGQGENRVVFV